MSRFLLRPTVDRDLIEIFRYLARTASVTRADQLLAHVHDTLELLARQPGLGTLYETDDPILAALRYCPVIRHRRYLIFYQTIADGIEVYRILHGSRDLTSLLDEAFEVDEDEELPP